MLCIFHTIRFYDPLKHYLPLDGTFLSLKISLLRNIVKSPSRGFNAGTIKNPILQGGDYATTTQEI